MFHFEGFSILHRIPTNSLTLNYAKWLQVFDAEGDIGKTRVVDLGALWL